MKRLVLKSSLCKDCGVCCYTCSYLGPNGCTNTEFLENSRCISFPILYGNPEDLGYKDLLTPVTSKSKYWFIVFEPKCLLLQHEKIANSLRQTLKMVNDEENFRIAYFQFGEENLLVAFK